MPPKKKEEAPKKVILGRASNTLKMGLVGLPNVGKSTTFNALSNLNVPAENFPFCTIDPNVAKIHVPDKRFEHLIELFKPKSKVLAQFSITDIAGLVKGASSGAGLGNAFLSHIAAVDGIFHVVRAFPNEEIIHEEGEIDPIRDIEIINGELIAKDLQSVEKSLEALEAEIKRKNQKVHRDERDIIVKVKEALTKGVFVRDCEWKAGEIETLNKHLYITAKPTVYLVNIGYEQYKTQKNKWLPMIQEYIKQKGGDPMIPFSAEFEKEVAEVGPDPLKRQAKAKEMGARSMLDRIIKVGYSHLQLIHYFTAGEDEVKCWTLRNGSKAPQAAGIIHTDFEKGFICAEVYKYNDLKEHGSEQAVKAEGLYRQQGKEYLVEDGDIIFFKFNVTTKAKKIEK